MKSKGQFSPLHHSGVEDEITDQSPQLASNAAQTSVLPPRPVARPPPMLSSKKNPRLLLMRTPKQPRFSPLGQDGSADTAEDDGPNTQDTEEEASRCGLYEKLKAVFEFLKRVLVGSEARIHCAMALPVVFNMVCFRVPWMISLAFVGRLGQLELAACALASTLANVTGMSVLVGLSSAQSTLSAQAFGAKQFELVGVILQRTVSVLLLACVGIGLLWAYGVGPFLRLTGQDPLVVKLAEAYLIWSIPGLAGFALNVSLMRFLQAQGLPSPPAAAAFVTALLHAPINWVLIYGLDMGLMGAAVATSINSCLTPLLLLAIVTGNCGLSPLSRYLLPAPTPLAASASSSSSKVNTSDDDEEEGEGQLAVQRKDDATRDSDGANDDGDGNAGGGKGDHTNGATVIVDDDDDGEEGEDEESSGGVAFDQKRRRARLLDRVRNKSGGGYGRVSSNGGMSFSSSGGDDDDGDGEEAGGTSSSPSVGAGAAAAAHDNHESGSRGSGGGGNGGDGLELYRQCWAKKHEDEGLQVRCAEVFDPTEVAVFMRLAGAGLVMVMEWWASEIAILMGGAVDGAVGLATLSLYQTTNSFCFMFAKGFEVSTSTRVGVLLGSGDADGAKEAAAVGPCLAFLLSSCLGCLLLLGRHDIPTLFTGTATDEALDLSQRVSFTYAYLCVYVVGDAMSTCFGGALTGCGRQRFSALVVLLAYGVVALPLAATLSFVFGKGYLGIVFAMTLGTWVQCSGNAALVAATDFKSEAASAAQRAQASTTTTEAAAAAAAAATNPTQGGVAEGAGEASAPASKGRHSFSIGVRLPAFSKGDAELGRAMAGEGDEF